jgi:hypothetical protein
MACSSTRAVSARASLEPGWRVHQVGGDATDHVDTNHRDDRRGSMLLIRSRCSSTPEPRDDAAVRAVAMGSSDLDGAAASTRP